jgi:predicted nucleic acid-binding protein
VKLYFDSCYYNRPYDGYIDEQSVAEVAAIEAIAEIAEKAGFIIYGSPAITDELDTFQNNKPKKWRDVRNFYNRTEKIFLSPTPTIMERAQSFMAAGLGDYDSFHLAFAEAAGVDVLLTTDKQFINTCERAQLSTVNVINPTIFLPEVEKWL